METHQGRPTLREDIFDGLSLIQDYVLPFESMEGFLIRHNKLIRSDDDMEGRVGGSSEFFVVEEFSNHLPLLQIPPIWQHSQAWRELLKLLLPIEESRARRDNQKRAIDAFVLTDVTQQGDGLDSLPQSHLVCEYSINGLLV